MKAETTTDVGPYETEHQARNAPLGVEVRELHDSGRTLHGDSDGLVAATKLRHLTEACTAAGIDLGTYDWRILRWLTTWEPSTIQVFAGIIARAAASGRAEVEQLRAERDELRVGFTAELHTTSALHAELEQVKHWKARERESSQTEIQRLLNALRDVSHELYEGTRGGAVAIVDEALGVTRESIGGPRPVRPSRQGGDDGR